MLVLFIVTLKPTSNLIFTKGEQEVTFEEDAGITDATEKCVGPTVIIDVLLICIERDNGIGDIDFDSNYEGICEGGTDTLESI